MNAERWQQIDELFDQALEIAEAERAAFLSEKCGADEELKREVISLLEAREKSDKFMENSAMNIAARHLAGAETVAFEAQFTGKTIGAYTIERMLGAGGMGEVYLAHDARLDRKVALKILPAEFVSEPERLKRFEIEARAVSALNHPNIVTIYDVGKVEGVNYIATEYVEGKTFRELIGTDLKVKEILALVSQAAEALAAAHDARIIHRDIKPENIMVRPDGYVKVLDFGLAKLAEPETRFVSLRTMRGAVMGTLAYMSPEQASGEPVNQCTDVWSLGVVLYEMLTSKAPFKAENQQATLTAVLLDAPVSVTSLNESLPTELDRILERALEKDREMRYQTASDFRADLKRLKREIDSSPSWSASGGSASAKIHQPAKQNYYLIGAIAALLILASGAVLYFAARYWLSPDAPDWTKAKIVPLTDQTGTEYYPSLAPDGESFIFAGKLNSDGYDILSQRVGGKNVTNLTPDSPGDDTQPVFSPDGKYIAFRSERAAKGIYVMEKTGENLRRVCDFGHNPSWSPDGTEIVVSTDTFYFPLTRNLNDLFVVNVASGEKRLLISGYATQPNWSPNGKRIAFWMTQSGGRIDVATVAVKGGEPVLITNSAATNWNPVWSPDGQYLYFSSDRGGSMAFWRVAVDENTGETEGEPEIVATPAKFNQHLSFSRDGKRMIYVQTDEQSNIKAVNFDAEGEKVSGESFWITRRDQRIVRPEISPDGQQFVMRVVRLTQEDLVLVNRDGTNWRDLTNDEFFDRYPRWSPDGKRIAFSSDRSGKYEIWMIDADGGNLRQLTFNTPFTASLPVWSPDGQKLLFDVNHKTYILDLTKNWNEQTPQTLPNADIYKFCMIWDWSPDGSKLFGLFSHKQGKTYRGAYSFTTGKSEPLADISTSAVPSWLADSERVIYSHENKIFLTDGRTQKHRELLSQPQEKIANVGINRENNLIYFTVSTSESDIWLLDASNKQ